MNILVGDVGATNTRLAIMSKDELVFVKKYRTSSITSFSQVVNSFLQEAGIAGFTTNTAAFGVAGPHNEYSITLHNAKLTVSVSELLIRTALEYVRIANDVYCVAKEHDQLVISVGTGLGAALGSQPLEAGHLLFAAQSKSHQELVSWLESEIHRPIEYEHVLSGAGWLRVYEFLRQKHFVDAPAHSSPHNLSNDSSVCKQESVKLFSEVLAQFISQIQKLTSQTDVLLCGGVLQKNPSLAGSYQEVLSSDEHITLFSARCLL